MISPALNSRFLATSVICLGSVAASLATDHNWPQWRGSNGNGVANSGSPPVSWSEEENIRWKADIPGTGHATPIVWGDRIFILSSGEESVMDPTEQEEIEIPEFLKSRYDANKDGELDETERRLALRVLARFRQGGSELSVEAVPDKRYSFVTFCLDRNTGEVLWKQTAKTEFPHEGKHGSNSFSSGSPVTDGERVIANFGSQGVYCYDFEGQLLWERDLGKMRMRSGFGEATSPALHGDAAIIVRDQEDGSYVIALNKRTGKEIWKQERDEPANWSSPFIVEHDGRAEVVVNGVTAIRSYDVSTGELLWECGGHSGDVVPTVVGSGSVVYAMAGNLDSTAFAIELGHRSRLNGTSAIQWSLDRGTPYVSSPLYYDDHLYFVHHIDGVLSRVNAADGKTNYWRQKLDEIDAVFASPVAVADRIYIVGNNGTTAVVAAGSEFRILATNKLEDKFRASPVIIGDELLLRGDDTLYCIAHVETSE